MNISETPRNEHGESPHRVPPHSNPAFTAIEAAADVRICLDLAEGDAFSASNDKPPLPVLVAFGGGPLHQYQMNGLWDLGKAVEENSPSLVRSKHQQVREDAGDQWHNLLFQFGPREFLYVEDDVVRSYGATHSSAKNLVAEFNKKYFLEAKSSVGTFQLIKTGYYDTIDTESVTLDPSAVFSAENLDLYYGGGFTDWHNEFLHKLSESSDGLTILEGSPGTGKTSYLRHLISTLKNTHRFYFIPPSNMNLLSDPKFIDFWSDERKAHPTRKFVVILEDAEAALMTRDSDNRAQVSAILNLSNGMLADFLRLQIICTINCNASDIDQALLRPGRLLFHRLFARLDKAFAQRLAEHLGKTLHEAHDYSLAEVFAGQKMNSSRPAIGFTV